MPLPLILRLVAIAAFTVAAGVLAAPSAVAADAEIEAAKAQGVVGERIDGYLAVVGGGAEPGLLRKVEEVNAKRRAAYAEIARDTGASIEAVAQVTGEKLIARARSGQMVMDASGRWARKP